MPPSPTRAWWKPRGAQLEILPNLKKCFNQPFQPPSPLIKTANGHIAGLKFNNNKKNIN